MHHPCPRAIIGLVALAAVVAPTAASGQDDCEFVYPSGDLNMRTLTGGARITYVGNPHLFCRDGVEIWADSAISYSAQGMQHLIGSVRFIDRSGEMRAEEARYFTAQGRLQATRGVFVTDTVQGFTIENGDLIYLLQTSRRPQAQIDVRTGPDGKRPRAVLTMQAPAVDSTEVVVAEEVADSTQVATAEEVADSTQVATAEEVADSTQVVSAEEVADSTQIVSAEEEVADSTQVVSAEEVADTTQAGDPGEVELEVEDDRTVESETPPETNTPYVVDGDRIFIQGDNYFRANGNVEIERDSLHAFADSAEYDQTAGRMLLRGAARVDGLSYDLTGRTIDLVLNGNDVDEVVALRRAVLTGEDIRLTAPEIRMYLEDGGMERLVAVDREAEAIDAPDDGSEAESRPRATSDGFELTADSLDVSAPGEILDRIFAAGRARSVSAARDSLNVEVLPEIARSDWLEGDTVIVVFLPPDSASRNPADTSEGQSRIDRIVARVGARNLYRLPSADSSAVPGRDAPAVHYVVGDEITIVMVDGEVDRMDILGQTRGVHLEPVPVVRVGDSLVADSLVDSMAVDTAAVPDTSMAQELKPSGPPSDGGPTTPYPKNPGNTSPAAPATNDSSRRLSA